MSSGAAGSRGLRWRHRGSLSWTPLPCLPLSGSFPGRRLPGLCPSRFKVSKKEQVLAPGEVPMRMNSDWTSLGLGSPFNQSCLVGSCWALLGRATPPVWRGGSLPGDGEPCGEFGNMGVRQLETRGLSYWGSQEGVQRHKEAMPVPAHRH